MTHKSKIKILETLVPNVLVSKKDWGRELHVFNKLMEQGIEEESFWAEVEFNYEFRSLAHLLKNNCFHIKKKYKEYLEKEQKKKLKIFKLKYNL
jgi:hypothetical protein